MIDLAVTLRLGGSTLDMDADLLALTNITNLILIIRAWPKIPFESLAKSIQILIMLYSLFKSEKGELSFEEDLKPSIALWIYPWKVAESRA